MSTTECDRLSAVALAGAGTPFSRDELEGDPSQGGAAVRRVGCRICHVSDIVTGPAGTLIKGDTFVAEPES